MTSVNTGVTKMKYMYDYDYDYVEVDDEKTNNIARFFLTEDEAVFALYEQLFCNMNTVCKETVLKAMQYLVFCKDMPNQIEEIKHMTTDDVDVVHHREVEKAIDETTKEFKDKLYEILENKLF